MRSSELLIYIYIYIYILFTFFFSLTLPIACPIPKPRSEKKLEELKGGESRQKIIQELNFWLRNKLNLASFCFVLGLSIM